MELIKVSRGGALHFKLKDGRKAVSYPSGYVRVSTKGCDQFGIVRMYQINKVIRHERGFCTNSSGYSWWDYHYTRVLIPLQKDRLNLLLEFERKNCK